MSPVSADEAATVDTGGLLARLATSRDGLSEIEARARLRVVGPNTVRSRGVRPLALLVRQLDSALLGLLAGTATVSFFVGQRTDAVIIGVILAATIGLGFLNEWRAERANQALHSHLRQRTTVLRSGTWASCDLADLVPGDVVRLTMGQVVPADVRVLSAVDVECDESILTGEAAAVPKRADAPGAESWCAMGTIIHRGVATAVVCATGSSTAFGRIASHLGEHQEETAFQRGLRRYSMFLARIAAGLTSVIFVVNLVLGRPAIDAVLFSLAIAVGITPQLLPAVVTTSLASGSRRLARRKVLVKRLVCIEDLGEVDVLLTDKTGTLTEGALTFERATGVGGASSEEVLGLGLACNAAVADASGAIVGGDPLDSALRRAAPLEDPSADARVRLAILPFDHDRRIMSTLVDGPEGRVVVAKGAPEEILSRCSSIPSGAEALVADRFAAGARVVAVAVREAPGATALEPGLEHGLRLMGLLEFADRPKDSARGALERLESLGVTVKVATGDNPAVAEHVCRVLGLAVAGTLTGADIDRLDDDELARRLETTTVFARVNPEQKARIVGLHRRDGSDVAFLGDGVNDAVALHKADVGVSVDSATDVARDAADIILLEKNLDVLADGVIEGRRTFANSIKYVLMGTSSNFGNMFSAAAASAFLPFLPMLPSQILLNNLLYDAGQLTIPSDRVDEEQLARPSHWDLGMIRRFMTVLGPVSSLFDFLTFVVMLHLFDAGAELFRAGWFVESLATQSLVIFVIRSRRSPVVASRPSAPLTVATVAVVGVGALIPLSPLADTLGFARPPANFYAVLAVMVAGYLALVEAAKREFFVRLERAGRDRERRPHRRVRRRAARFRAT